MTELARNLVKFFRENNFEWNFGGVKRIPEQLEMEKVLDYIKKNLDERPDASVTLEIGRLLATKRDGVVDVYVHIGEI